MPSKNKIKYGTLSKKMGGGSNRIPNFSRYFIILDWDKEDRREGVMIGMSQMQHINLAYKEIDNKHINPCYSKMSILFIRVFDAY